MEVTAERIAQHFNGEIIGDPDVKVSSVAKIEQGKPGNICFLANPKYENYLYTCKASVIIINKTFKPKEPVEPTLILVDNAYEAVASLLDLLNTLKREQKRGRSWLSMERLISAASEADRKEAASRTTIAELRAKVQRQEQELMEQQSRFHELLLMYRRLAGANREYPSDAEITAEQNR